MLQLRVKRRYILIKKKPIFSLYFIIFQVNTLDFIALRPKMYAYLWKKTWTKR
jgi:hypothetical protein